MNVEQVAQLCNVSRRAYCLQLGDESIPEWNAAGAAYRESTVAGVRFVLAGLKKGVHIAAWDIHAAWMRYRLDLGWQHGDKKDYEAKTHPNLVPFDKLSKDEQRKYFLFIAIVEGCYRAGIDD